MADLQKTRSHLAAIDEALAKRLRTLKFAPAIEERYEAETRKARCRYLAVCGLISLAMFDIFLFTDFTIVPDVSDVAVILRLAIVTPIGLLLTCIVSRDPHPILRESLTCFVTVLVTAAILYLMVISRAPLRVHQHTGIVLVILFPTIAQRLHFRYAVATVVACTMTYAFALFQVGEMEPAIRQSAIMLLVGVDIFVLIASYRLEYQDRRFHLLSIRDRLRNEELEAISKTDPLTQFGNRRRLEDRFAELQAAGGGSPIAVVMLDIDKFKSFNDRYGHPAGDRCIREVAALARAELASEDDLAVRFGGEELLFVLVDSDLEEGLRVGEKIRAAIEAAAIPHEAGLSGVVTVSLGVASFIPDASIDPAELVAGADAALYAAKNNGRNQVWPPASRHAPVARRSDFGQRRSATLATLSS